MTRFIEVEADGSGLQIINADLVRRIVREEPPTLTLFFSEVDHLRITGGDIPTLIETITGDPSLRSGKLAHK